MFAQFWVRSIFLCILYCVSPPMFVYCLKRTRSFFARGCLKWGLLIDGYQTKWLQFFNIQRPCRSKTGEIRAFDDDVYACRQVMSCFEVDRLPQPGGSKTPPLHRPVSATRKDVHHLPGLTGTERGGECLGPPFQTGGGWSGYLPLSFLWGNNKRCF